MFRKIFAGLTFSALLGAAPAFAQAPANDDCAAAVVLPASGTQVNGTTVNAADNLIGLYGCQTGLPTTDHPDVWYQFISSGTTLNYTVRASSPGAGLEIFVLDGTCTTSYVILGSDCNSGTITGTLGGLQNGRIYYLVVASPNAASATAFTVQATTNTPPVTAAQDCNRAAIIATGAPISQGVSNSGSGLIPDEANTQNSCWGIDQERQSKWYKFVAGASGKLNFNINPNNSNDDYDWAVWDITGDPTGCTTKGDAIACNWTGQRGATGLSLCPTLEPGYLGGDQFDNKTTNQTGASAPISIVAGRVYALLVDNYSQTNAGFTLTFGGACTTVPSGQSIALIGLDAEFDYTKISCNEVSFSKVNQVPAGVAANFAWSFGDGATSNLQNPTHTYTNGSVYTVTLVVTDVLGGRNTFSRTITIAPPQPVINRSRTDDICVGDSVTMSANGADAYEWVGPGINGSFIGRTIKVKPTQTTIYRLIATRDFCTDTADVEVRVTPPQIAEGTIEKPLGAPPHTTGFSSTTPGANGWVWDFGDGSPTVTDSLPQHTYPQIGTYTVKLGVTYGNGCVAEMREIGVVNVVEGKLYNIITPNNDGKNDIFEARVSGLPLHLRVFNRWGRQVYEAKDYQQNWNGGDLPAATYYYLLEDTAGKSWKGWIQITR